MPPTVVSRTGSDVSGRTWEIWSAMAPACHDGARRGGRFGGDGMIPPMKMLSRVLILAGAAAVLGSVTLPAGTVKGALPRVLHLDPLGPKSTPLNSRHS